MSGCKVLYTAIPGCFRTPGSKVAVPGNQGASHGGARDLAPECELFATEHLVHTRCVVMIEEISKFRLSAVTAGKQASRGGIASTRRARSTMVRAGA
jgi:hypothetical protein